MVFRKLIWNPLNYPWGSHSGSAVRNPPAMKDPREMWVRSLGREDPLEEGMATHSSNLAWRIPWTEEPGRLQSMGSQRIGHDWNGLAHTQATQGFLGGSVVKNLCLQCRRHGFDPWIRKIPWRSKWQLTPLSCLENPMDRGAGWAIVHVIAKSQTLTEWLNSNNKTTQENLRIIISLTECFLYAWPFIRITSWNSNSKWKPFLTYKKTEG